MKFNNEAKKEGKGGSQKEVDRVDSRVETDEDDEVNEVEVKGKKKMSACSKALRKMKK